MSLCVGLQHTRNLTQPYSRASYAGPFNVGDSGAAHYHVTTSGGDVDDVISIKSYPTDVARTSKRSPKTSDIEVREPFVMRTRRRSESSNSRRRLLLLSVSCA